LQRAALPSEQVRAVAGREPKMDLLSGRERDGGKGKTGE